MSSRLLRTVNEENAVEFDGIVDMEAYNQMQKLLKHKIIQNQIYEASDGTEINLGWLPHLIKRKYAHLPKSERDQIDKLKEIYFKINNTITALQRTAYGRNNQGRRAKGKIENVPSTFLEFKREEVVDLFGRMFTIEEVHKIINEDWKVRVSRGTIGQFRAKYSDEIRKRVETHQLSFHNIRLGVKKSRLEELSELYTIQKDKWLGNEKREDLRVLITLLEQLRKEAEGDRLTLDGKIDINYEQNINQHLMKEVFATTNIKEIILGRVAAKMNINPVKLLYSLNQSYYKKFSNVLGDLNPEEENGEVVFPSQLSYDFERIGRLSKKIDLDVEDAIITEEKSNSQIAEENVNKLKENLLQKLRDKKNSAAQASSKNDSYEVQRNEDIKAKQKRSLQNHINIKLNNTKK